MPRTAAIQRQTKETRITGTVTLDGTGRSTIATGLGFLDHMLTLLASHARIDLELSCTGDLEVDDHHTAEDCALAMGAAIDTALADRRGIGRYGESLTPMDEALARVAIDLSGRAASSIGLGLTREKIGDVAAENLVHFFRSLAQSLRCAIHIDLIRGENDHHRAEAAFKGFARALRQAIAIDPARAGEVPSTKGVL
ncbi:MAG: imidazoleglycerol-phosphate dehydratase HisB [Planctomycetota bacterium]|nr:imidazoleglycerol-phosphate dehydratase HisB [Planctomycetota bacterium]